MDLLVVSILLFFVMFCGAYVLKARAVELGPKNTFILGEKVYEPTLAAWKSAIAGSGLEVRTVTWIGAVEGNGVGDHKHKNKSRNTIIFAPKNVKFDDTLETIFYFHGLTGFTKKEFVNRVLPNLDKMIKRGQNFILVFPELPWANQTLTRRGRQRVVWNYKDRENFNIFYSNILTLINSKFLKSSEPRAWRPENLIIIGHSAGGSAIRMAAKNGGLVTANPKRVVFSDASYGTWLDQAWNSYFSNNPDCEVVVLVRKGDNPWLNAVRFLKRFRNVPERLKPYVFNRKKYTHTSIGNQALLWSWGKEKLPD